MSRSAPYNQFLLLCREMGDVTSLKLFETIIDEEQIHFNYFDNVDSHIKNLDGAYLARIAGNAFCDRPKHHGVCGEAGRRPGRRIKRPLSGPSGGRFPLHTMPREPPGWACKLLDTWPGTVYYHEKSGRQGMKIKWYGHAAFRITTDQGVRIIMDPYQSGAFGGALSYGKITDEAGRGHHIPRSRRPQLYKGYQGYLPAYRQSGAQEVKGSGSKASPPITTAQKGRTGEITSSS